MRHSLIFILLVSVFSCQPKQASISEFRGPERSGVYQEEGLLNEWTESGPTEILFIDGLGNGYASPTFVDDRFYITGEVDSITQLYCYKTEGELIWQVALGPEWVTTYPGSRSAPTIVDELIYVGTGMGALYCLNVSDGSLLWSREFEGVYPMHGFAETPLIYDDLIFWTLGGEKDNVLGLDRFTGEKRWSNPGHGEVMGYNPGNLIHLAERALFVTFSAYHLMGLDAETGELLWSHEQDNLPLEQRKSGYGDTHSNTVIYDNDAIYYAAGDGNCGVKLTLSSDGSTIDEAWRNKLFDGYMGGIVKLGSHVYGTGTSKAQLKSIDSESGIITDSLSIGRGALIAADSMLYYYNQRGTMYLVACDKGRMQVVSSFQIKKGTAHHFAHPVIHNGILYQRRGDALMGYAIK